MKKEQTGYFETLAFKIQIPGHHPEVSVQQNVIYYCVEDICRLVGHIVSIGMSCVLLIASKVKQLEHKFDA